MEKEKLYSFCTDYLQQRLSGIRKRIEEVEQGLGSETKSSAGDKHETGRAMLQLEREKLGLQWAEAEKMQQLLARVPWNNSHTHGGLGSLVQTDKATYFIAISAGAFAVEGQDVFCISPSTPMGRLLLGKTIGETFTFNGTTFKITSIQ